MKNINHYDWLDEHFKDFAIQVGAEWMGCDGIIPAHGDKCYGYESRWEHHGIPFHHGVAIYLLTYLNPFCDEVRQTKDGWVNVDDWIVNNYYRFDMQLKEIDLEESS